MTKSLKQKSTKNLKQFKTSETKVNFTQWLSNFDLKKKKK